MTKVVVARKLRRKEVLAFFAKLPPCLVGMEAYPISPSCSGSHYPPTRFPTSTCTRLEPLEVAGELLGHPSVGPVTASALRARASTSDSWRKCCATENSGPVKALRAGRKLDFIQ
jgi:hypothetical protein